MSSFQQLLKKTLDDKKLNIQDMQKTRPSVFSSRLKNKSTKSSEDDDEEPPEQQEEKE